MWVVKIHTRRAAVAAVAAACQKSVHQTIFDVGVAVVAIVVVGDCKTGHALPA